MATTVPQQSLHFVKSSFCAADACIQVAADPASGHIVVAGGQLDEHGTMHFTYDEWEAFIRGVRNGELGFEPERHV